jgi:hypothetical protein
VTLKLTMVRVSVRTAALPQVQLRPSTTSCRTCERSAGFAHRQPHAREQQRAQGQEDGLGDERPGRPGDEEGGTHGGTDHLVHDERAGHQPGVADAEVGASDDHRQQRAAGGVGEDLGDAEDEERGQDRDDADVPGEQGGREDDEDAAAGQVHADDQPPAVDAVGEDTRCRPRSSHGSRCTRAPRATRNGSWVWPATSSGPAASAMPSPRLPTQDDPTSQRNGVPIRAGSALSTGPRTGTDCRHRPRRPSAAFPTPGRRISGSPPSLS